MQITFEGNTIEVKEYLPIAEKYNLVKTTIAEATEDNGLISDIQLDLFFNINLLMQYTDIQFSDDDTPAKIYDDALNSGLLDAVIKAIPNKEYNALYEYITKEVANQERYAGTMAGTLEAILKALPAGLEKVKESLADFDAEKYSNVIDFAKANGMKLGKE